MPAARDRDVALLEHALDDLLEGLGALPVQGVGQRHHELEALVARVVGPSLGEPQVRNLLLQSGHGLVIEQASLEASLESDAYLVGGAEPDHDHREPAERHELHMSLVTGALHVVVRIVLGLGDPAGHVQRDLSPRLVGDDDAVFPGDHVTRDQASLPELARDALMLGGVDGAALDAEPQRRQSLRDGEERSLDPGVLEVLQGERAVLPVPLAVG